MKNPELKACQKVKQTGTNLLALIKKYQLWPFWISWKYFFKQESYQFSIKRKKAEIIQKLVMALKKRSEFKSA